MPAPGAIGFHGFGPAPFGATEEQVRIAWGRELGGLKPDQSGGCYYLMPQPRSQQGYRVAFMFEGDTFVRMDVDAPDIEAPGGGRVGMQANDILQRYAGHVHVQPHKYVEGGQYLRVPNPDGGTGVVLFETDADGRVTGWRIGEPPQVDYVEGCS
ncbi:MAG TPA: lectin [Lysobacter sp.]